MGAMMQIKPIHTVVALFSKSVVHLAPCQEVTSHLNPGMYVGASLSGHKNTPYIDDMLPRRIHQSDGYGSLLRRPIDRVRHPHERQR